MAVSLLPIQGGCSLEFAEADIERVRQALEKRYGLPEVDKGHPTITIYRYPSADLTFQNDWEDPCLIATNACGIAMLEHIANELA
ncbi:hypothetical protein D3C81_1508610 [compost metagenome]